MSPRMRSGPALSLILPCAVLTACGEGVSPPPTESAFLDADEIPCRLEFAPTGVTLRGDHAGTTPDPGPWMSRGPDGRFYTSTSRDGEVAIWSPTGDFDADGVFIDVRRSVDLVAVPSHLHLLDSVRVLNSGLQAGQREFYFHLVDLQGDTEARFGPISVEDMARPDRPERDVAVGSESFWVAPWRIGEGHYTLEEWSFDGRLLRSIHRRPRWLAEASDADEGLPWFRLHMDGNGRLLVIALLSNADRDSGQFGEIGFEIIDPRGRDLLVSEVARYTDDSGVVFPFFDGSVEGARLTEDEQGLPRVEIVEYRLEPRDRTSGHAVEVCR